MSANTPSAILANKLTANITIGILGWYCYIPGIQYNGSYAAVYPEAYNSTYIDLNGNSGATWVFDAAAHAAANIINTRADILPYNYVNIKRFSDCGAYWPTVDTDFSGHTGGFAMSVMGMDVGARYPDVLGITGQEYSAVAKGTAEVFGKYQVPFCGTNSAAPSLSDKNKFPYFFRLISSSGLGNYVGVLLQSWNVTRMAIIAQSDDLLGSGYAKDVQTNAPKYGVSSISMINLKGKLTQDMVNYAKIAIQRDDVRYIYISGQVDFVSKAYFSLALIGMVAPQYVYMGSNIPGRITTSMGLLSKNLTSLNKNVTQMAAYMQGFIGMYSNQAQANNPIWLDPFYQQFKSIVKLDQQTADDQYLNSGANITLWGVNNYFDCVMTLLFGFDKLLKDNPSFTPQQLASRQLSQYLNYSQFINTNYTGLTAAKIYLNSLGDMVAPYVVTSYTGVYKGGFQSKTFAMTDTLGTNITFLNGTSPLFYGGSSIPPPDGPIAIPLNYLSNTFGTSAGSGIVAMFALGIIVSGCFLTFFIAWQKDKKLKMLSIPESVVTIIGSFFCYLSIIFHLNAPTKQLCVARIWLVLIGYVLMIQPVIMKNVRLYIILKSKKRLDAAMLTLINRITITVGILVELALLGYWVGGSNTGPLQVIVGTDAFDICSSVNKPSSVSIQVLEGYTIFVHCLLFVLAYMMKDVDQKFNEAPALSTIGVMNAVLFGVIMILPSNPTPSMDLIQCICIWIGTTLTLLILFGAKIYEVIFDTMSEKGLLKMSIKSTFDAGRSSAKSGFASSKMVSAVFVPAMPKAMKQDTSEHSQDSSNQEKSSSSAEASMTSNAPLVGSPTSPTSPTGNEKKEEKAKAAGPSRAMGGLINRNNQTTSGLKATPSMKKLASGGKDVKEKRRPCHCKPILGIHVFKIKTSKTQVLWNVWNGGVCYFNNIRKRTWMSIATLDKVYALTIMSTVKCERIAGTNQISLSDFPSFAFNVVIEFKDEKALEGFLSEFTAHKAHMLVQHE